MKKKKFKGHKGSPIETVAWSADSKILASGGSDSDIILWNKEGKPIKKIDSPEYQTKCIAWSSGGTLAGLVLKLIKLWDSDGKKLKEFEADAFEKLVWSPDGNFIATNTIDSKINIWKTDGTHVKELTGHTGYINGFGWSNDVAIFVTASDDAKIRLWNPTDWTEIKVLSEHYESVSCLAWAPDGQNFAVGSWTYKEKFVRIYDREGKSTQVLKGEQDKIMALDWSKKWITSGSSDKTVIIFKPDGTLVETIKIGKAVTGVAISPDEKWLAVSCWDSNIYIFDLTELK